MDSIAESETENSQTGLVWRSYCQWFLTALILSLLASAAAYGVSLYCPLDKLWIRILQIIGAVIEATALGQCGFAIQTWDGTSRAEKLNSRLFLLCSSIGFALLVFSFQLEDSAS